MITFLVVLVGWVFFLCLHEFSHALVAYMGGDITVREKGYLTFNPLKYTHPIYSLLLPILFLVMGGIGLPGGAVYIETWRLRSKWWESAVSMAGPLSNLLLAAVLAGILQFAPIGAGGAWPGLGWLSCRFQRWS
jgi:Zn-dependent protease